MSDKGNGIINPKINVDKEEFFKEHMRLANYICNKYWLHNNNPHLTYEDLQSAGYFALVKAYNTFDPDKAKWSTYAGKVITNELFMLFRKNKKHIGVLSFDHPFKSVDGDELFLIDTIQDSSVDYDVIDAIMLSEGILKELKKKDRDIFVAYAEGYSQKEIAKKHGLSQSGVSKAISRVRKAANKIYSMEGNDGYVL